MSTSGFWGCWPGTWPAGRGLYQDPYDDFGRLNFGEGETPPKPALDVTARDTAGHAFGLIRVLGDDGKASGP